MTDVQLGIMLLVLFVTSLAGYGLGYRNGQISGELVGLNFDRVFEAVSGDFGWNAERSRNISCDIRYVLWVVDAVLPSPGLLKELGV